MTDARIITREDVLELTEDLLITVFRAGYEYGQKMACMPVSESETSNGLTESEREFLLKEHRGKHAYWQQMKQKRREEMKGD